MEPSGINKPPVKITSLNNTLQKIQQTKISNLPLGQISPASYWTIPAAQPTGLALTPPRTSPTIPLEGHSTFKPALNNPYGSTTLLPRTYLGPYRAYPFTKICKKELEA